MLNIYQRHIKLIRILESRFSQTSLIVIGDAITFGANFLSIMVLARLLPVDTMGTYRQLVYLGGFFISLFEFGVSSSIYRFWNILEITEKSTYSKMIFGFLAFFGTIAALLLFFLSTKLSLWYQNPALEKFIKIIAFYPLANMVIMMVRPIMISDGHSLFATGIETFFAILSFLALSIPVLLQYSFEDSLRIWIFTLLFRLLLVPVLTRKYLLRKSKFIDIQLYRKVLEYVLPIQAARIPGIIMSYFDKIYMSLLLNPYQFAIYSLGAREIPFIGTIGYSVSSALIPKLVRDNVENNIDPLLSKWKSACRKTALYTYLPLSFCIIFANWVIEFFYSNTYIESASIFQIFAGITFFRVIEYASLAKSIGESKLILKVALVSLAVLVIFAYPISRSFGAVGMALLLFISTFVSVIYFLTWYKRYFQIPLQKFYPLNELLRYLAYSFISTGLVKFIINDRVYVDGSDLINLFLQISILFACCAAIYFGFVFIDNKICHRLSRKIDINNYE